MKKDGCEWKGKLGDFEKHLNCNPSPESQLIGCQFVDVECRYECGEQFKRCKISSHQNKNCNKRPYSCEYCNEYVSTYEVVTKIHYSNCGQFPVTCPNECREDLFQRKDLKKHFMDECPLTEIDCPLHYAGCNVRLPRQDMPEHMMKDSITHLTLLATVTQSLLKENQELRQRVEEKDKCIDEAVKEIQELRLKITDREVQTRRSIEAVTKTEAEACKNIAELQTEVKHLKQNVQKLRFHKLGLPVDFKVNRYDDEVYLPGFYTHSHGYKMCLNVIPDGCGDGEGTHVSAYIYIMQGPFDNHLKWPFRGEITIQLVNQAGDHSHVEETVVYDDDCTDEEAGRVTGKNKRSPVSMGIDEFHAHRYLGYNRLRNTLYMNDDDIIIFRVTEVVLY